MHRVLNIDEFYSNNSFKVDDSFLDRAVAFLRAYGYEVSRSQSEGMWVLSGRFSWVAFGPTECSTANKLRVLRDLDLNEDDLFNYKYIFVNTDEHDSAKVELIVAGYTFSPMDVLSPGRFKIKRPESNRNRQDTKDYGSISRDCPNAFVFKKEGLISFAMRTAESLSIDFGSDDFTGISAQGSLLEGSSLESSPEDAAILLRAHGNRFRRDGDRLFVQCPYIAFYSGNKEQVKKFKKLVRTKMKELGIPVFDMVSPNGPGSVFALPDWDQARLLAGALMDPEDPALIGKLTGHRDFKFYRQPSVGEEHQFVGIIWIDSNSKTLGLQVEPTVLRKILDHLRTRPIDGDRMDVASGEEYTDILMETSGRPDSEFPKMAGLLSHFGIKLRKRDRSPRYVLEGATFIAMPPNNSKGEEIAKELSTKSGVPFLKFHGLESVSGISANGIVFLTKEDIDRFFNAAKEIPGLSVGPKGINMGIDLSTGKRSFTGLFTMYTPDEGFKPTMTANFLKKLYKYALEKAGGSIGDDEVIGRYHSDLLMEEVKNVSWAISYANLYGYDASLSQKHQGYIEFTGSYSFMVHSDIADRVAETIKGMYAMRYGHKGCGFVFVSNDWLQESLDRIADDDSNFDIDDDGDLVWKDAPNGPHKVSVTDRPTDRAYLPVANFIYGMTRLYNFNRRLNRDIETGVGVTASLLEGVPSFSQWSSRV